MLITSSIVTYNTDKEELAKCLQSLINSPISQIYVCDNSPSNDLEQFCSSYDKVTYIFNNANLGYGAGHNVALRHALANRADYHLVINTDVYFDDQQVSTFSRNRHSLHNDHTIQVPDRQ